MGSNQFSILYITCLVLFLGTEGCRTPNAAFSPVAIDPAQVESGILLYSTTDQRAMSFDSLPLSQPMLHRFVRAWNNSGKEELRKFLPRSIIKVKFKDGAIRTFRMNSDAVKETNDWCTLLNDTTIRISLDSLRALNERWIGSYSADNSAHLVLQRNGIYDYSFNQCTRGTYSNGHWSTSGDTLHLHIDPNSRTNEDSRFKYADFSQPFVLKGRQLFFTVDRELNWHHFFTKE